MSDLIIITNENGSVISLWTDRPNYTSKCLSIFERESHASLFRIDNCEFKLYIYEQVYNYFTEVIFRISGRTTNAGKIRSATTYP